MAEYDRASIMAVVLEDLSHGKSLRSICKADGMPAESTVRLWMKDEEFAAHSARARELGFDSIAEECLEIADDNTEKAEDRRIRIDTRIRLLGKWSQRYSDKHDFQHAGPGGGPIGIDLRFV